MYERAGQTGRQTVIAASVWQLLTDRLKPVAVVHTCPENFPVTSNCLDMSVESSMSRGTLVLGRS